jgi:hypothetical protein
VTTDKYKRSSDGKFAKTLATNLDAAQEITSKLITSETNTETIRKAAVTAFAKAASTAALSGDLPNSFAVGSKGTPGAALAAIGGVMGQNAGGKKGEAIGKVIGAVLGGGATGGLPGALAGGVSAAIMLDSESKDSLEKAIAKPALFKKNIDPDTKFNLATPAIEAVDKSLKGVENKLKEKSAELSVNIDKASKYFEDGIAKNGLTEAADLTSRAVGASVASGAISQGLLSGGVGVLGKMAGGALGGVASASMSLGITGGGDLGKKIGGSEGEAIGRVVGGAIGAGLGSVMLTGGTGLLPAMAVGGAVGLATSNPGDIARMGANLGKSKNTIGKQIGDAAKEMIEKKG